MSDMKNIQDIIESIKNTIPVELTPNNYYEIQSVLNPKYGATIYPQNVHNDGAGFFVYKIKNKETLTPMELRDVAGDKVANELIDNCYKLLNKENHYE